jgi:hypothetical protein
MVQVPLFAETLRFSAFSSVPIDFRRAPVDEWWRVVANAEPEQVSRNANNGQAVAEGVFSTGRLAVAAGPGGLAGVCNGSSLTGWPVAFIWDLAKLRQRFR